MAGKESGCNPRCSCNGDGELPCLAFSSLTSQQALNQGGLLTSTSPMTSAQQVGGGQTGKARSGSAGGSAGGWMRSSTILPRSSSHQVAAAAVVRADSIQSSATYDEVSEQLKGPSHIPSPAYSSHRQFLSLSFCHSLPFMHSVCVAVTFCYCPSYSC
jgi:hypothetical protein